MRNRDLLPEEECILLFKKNGKEKINKNKCRSSSIIFSHDLQDIINRRSEEENRIISGEWINEEKAI